MRLHSSTSRICFVLLTLTACNIPEPPPDAPDAQLCCEDRGFCSELQHIDESVIGLLDIDGCPQEALCVPNELAVNGLPPARCRTASTGAEGRCLPACLLGVSEQGERVTRDGCAAEQRCMPCYDPFGGAATGACSVNSDRGPKEPPVTFAECCGGSGRCMPEQLLTDEHRLLGGATCADGTRCVADQALLVGAEALSASTPSCR